MKVCTVSQMRAMDAAATVDYGISPEILMENAGIAAVQLLHNLWGTNPKRVLVFCGSGNNGGDGFVVARKLHSYGHSVCVFVLCKQEKISNTARRAYEMMTRLPLDIYHNPSLEEIKHNLSHSAIIVDAILGTGLEREVSGLFQQVIGLINEVNKPVLSLDIPSGIHGDSGEVLGTAIQAEVTLTFGLPKLGNLLNPGFAFGGRLFISHISFPPQLYHTETINIEINQAIAMPPRSVIGHKGSFGQLLCIGGATSYYGAPYFSAMAFLKSGGGYARLAAPKSIIPFLAVNGSEIVFIPQEETSSGSIAMSNKISLLELTERLDMVVLGPGLSLEEETQQLARMLCTEINKPLIIDGDGITALSKDMNLMQARSSATILTPHLAEMGKLCGLSVAQVEADKVNLLRKTAAAFNAYIVLKGAHTLIAYPDGKLFINMSGNDGMATAGSGDVLTGIIAAMLGLGLSVQEAVRQGVYLHGLAADLAAQQIGKDGITAQDILSYAPYAVKTAREEQLSDQSVLGFSVV